MTLAGQLDLLDLITEVEEELAATVGPLRPARPQRTGWWDDILCAGPAMGDAMMPNDMAQAEVALRVCRRCPARVDCDRDAQADPPEYGVRGGVLYGLYPTRRQRSA